MFRRRPTSPGSRRRLSAYLLFSLCWAILSPSHASDSYRILAVLSDAGGPYRQTLETFRGTVTNTTGHATPVEFEMLVLDGRAQAPPPGSPPPDLIVPVGTRAARAVQRWGAHSPVFNILITREVFGALYPDHAATAHTRKGKRRVSAVFLEQPLRRQFQFIRLALPRLKHCGILLSEQSRTLVPEIGSAAAATGMELDVVDMDEFGRPVEGFRRVMGDSEVILALPDSRVLSPSRAKWLLYMAYQRKVPIIGFSRAIVDAGALGAVYSTPSQIGRQAAEDVIQIILDIRERPGAAWVLPAPRYPRYFEIAINRAVARSLGIDVKESHRIAQALTTVEQSEKWRARY